MRRYRMSVRADSAQANGERILGAAKELFSLRPYDHVALDDVAAAASVTVRTVVRRFGSKEGLFDAVTADRAQRIRQRRDGIPAGDISKAISGLADSYEESGDAVLNMLAQERRTAVIGEVVKAGRRYHQAWVERIFSPLLTDHPSASRRRRLAQLCAMTDIYTWKVLRRDLGLGPLEVVATLEDLARTLVQSPTSGRSRR